MFTIASAWADAPQSAPQIKYRADIDGLRALAILPVLMFHAQFEAFSGGYVGVDVFFVVSGYLITSLIQTEITKGTFTYVSFWERRARRLLPPIFLVTVVSCLLAYTLLLPEDLKDFGQSVFALSAFTSNVLFWLKSGYFATSETTVPLVHSWSLAVEEQFYLLFPALLLLVRNYTTATRWTILLGGTLASFALSEWMVRSHPEGAYYLLPPRAWELALGALLALIGLRPRLPVLVGDLLLGVGLAMVLVPVFAYDKSTPFPGTAALLPCAGTAIVIALGQSPTGRLTHLLTNRIALYIGTRSYALYLWHWPLLVFWSTASNRPLSSIPPLDAATVLLLSFAAASLSTHLVENPIRHRRILKQRSSLFLFCGAMSAGLGTFGLYVHFNNGLEGRIPIAALTVAKANDWIPRQIECGRRSEAQVRSGDLCKLGTQQLQIPDFLVWGDSHAKALMVTVDEVAESYGLMGLQASRGACLPLIDVKIVGNPSAIGCERHNEAVRELISNNEFDSVILIGLWNGYGLTHGEGSIRHIDGGLDDRPAAEIFALQFRKTLAFLRSRGANVVVVEEPPYPKGFRPERAAYALWTGRTPRGRDGQPLSYDQLSLQDYLVRNRRMSDLLNSLATIEFKRIAPIRSMCDDEVCPAITEGRSNFRDSNHLTNHGARQLSGSFGLLFEEISRRTGR